ncbi:MAG: helix-turn-helix domain-containing protein [Candidatus Omnitrophica bacterium]|nr:helix-turn-helix domain-containing protein [Candidatus Omnitrophota bacterium]
MNATMIERRFLGIDDFSDYLGVPKGTLYVWVCQKKIPYLKIGKLLKFDMKEIEPWLKDKRFKEIH